MKRNAQSGFSVIEALVAVAVIAIALVPLLTLQAQVSRDHVRQRSALAQVTAQRNALALLRDMNPMESPRGDRNFGTGERVHWESRPLTRIVRTTDRGSGDGAFDVALFAITVTVEGDPEAEPLRIVVEQVGWRPIASATTGARPPGLSPRGRNSTSEGNNNRNRP